MEKTQQSILDLARTRGLIRPLDLAAHGLPRVSLTRLVRQGRPARVWRGLHALPDRGFKYRRRFHEIGRSEYTLAGQGVVRPPWEPDHRAVVDGLRRWVAFDSGHASLRSEASF
jgi:hypothetical protein